LTIDLTESELTIHLDGTTRTVARTTDLPVRWIKAHRPRKVRIKSLGRALSMSWDRNVKHVLGLDRRPWNRRPGTDHVELGAAAVADDLWGRKRQTLR
jgi:hypothetical protein